MLQDLANEAPEAALRQEAKASLARIKKLSQATRKRQSGFGDSE